MSNRNFASGIIAVFFGLCACTTAAPVSDLPRLPGTVTRVVDGDTLDVRLASGPIRVRLHGIDAPERNQPWGKEAAAALTKQVLHRDVELEPFEQDRYERLIATVFVGDREINGDLIRQGHAWAYRRYMTKRDAGYCSFEAAARDAGMGLWGLKQAEPIPPWQWRRGKADGRSPQHLQLSAKMCVMEIEQPVPSGKR